MVGINNRRRIVPSSCRKKSHRTFRKSTKNFSVKMLRDIILMMVDLVEKIGHAMKEAERRIMLCDGSSKNGTDCAGLFACFVKKILDRKEKVKLICEDVAKLVLITCSPLSNMGKFISSQDSKFKRLHLTISFKIMMQKQTHPKK